MEKRTLLAVVLSVVVISGSYLIQSFFFPVPTQGVADQRTEQTDADSTSQSKTPIRAADSVQAADSALPILPAGAVAVEEPAAEERPVIETDLVRVTFSSRGGDVLSYKLKEHRDGNDYVEMIFAGTSESRAFTLALGDAKASPLSDLFHVRRPSDTVVEFYRDYALPGEGGAARLFRLTKRYEFQPGEYLFELAVTLDGGYTIPSLNFSGAAYTLEFGPQIGPRFEKLSGEYEYRHFYTYAAGKRKTEKVSAKEPTVITNRISWAAIAGKYFTFVAIPDATQYEFAFSMAPVSGVPETSRLFITRPPVSGSKTTDLFRFYLGPKNQKALGVYDIAEKNAYRLSDLNIGAVASTSGFLGPLEEVLKWFLMIFFRVIPNYGIAIILLTILVKVLMFPLTKKSSESTLRMQALSPKIKELQEKYRDNSQKMNVEMAELYKREGYNPMSGCLPMLLQIPIFFAMYNLFNNHFDLRGALFIPGWIPDLSLPESVWSFAPFRIPMLNWSDLRLLPFLYLGSQLLYGKVTQTPDQQGNAQMKMMLYLMPIIFFFILYDVPSGLLLYWIMSNVLTMGQQLAINKYLAKKKAHMAASAAAAGPVIAPKRKKK